jgi:GTPase SAR1 family protein
MPFGQLVIGSPGSGKTTYCHGLHQFLTALHRPITIINLDPANGQSLPYPCAINIASLITVKDVMKELGLGPNGAMIYCMEYLEENFEWLESQMDALGDDAYVAFDLPGQVELSTNHGSLRRILERLQKKDWRLVAVHLIDASHITDASRYISLLLLSLRAMLMLELPHVNVLSKVDLLGEAAGLDDGDGSRMSEDDDDDEEAESRVRARAGGLAFNLDYYTEVQDLSYLMDHLRSSQGPRRSTRLSELNERICDLVEDFGLVSFETLAVEDKRSMIRLQRVLDKATGYVYVERKGEESKSNSNIQPNSQPLRDVPLPLDDDSAMAAYEPRDATKRGTAASAASLFTVADRGAPMGWGSAADVQERWVDNREDWEHFEIKERTDLEARWEKSAEPGPSQDSSGKASTGSVQERMAPTTTL